jgi:hypothetical protein
MMRTLLFAACLLAAVPAFGKSPESGKMSSRFVRVEGAAAGGLFETGEARPALSGRIARVTCVLGRVRAGLGYLDAIGRPMSWGEQMLWPVHVGVTIWSCPKRTWQVYGMVPEVYAEAVVSLWSPPVARYEYHPNARLVLCCDIDYYGVGARAELGYMVGRSAVYAGIQVRAPTFGIGF